LKLAYGEKLMKVK